MKFCIPVALISIFKANNLSLESFTNKQVCGSNSIVTNRDGFEFLSPNNGNEIFRDDLKFSNGSLQATDASIYANISTHIAINEYFPVHYLENACLDFSGNKADPTLIIVGAEENASSRAQYTSNLPRYREVGINFVSNYSNSWLWTDETVLHQHSWMWNFAHQFHEGLWPLHMALHFGKNLNIHEFSSVLIAGGQRNDNSFYQLNTSLHHWKQWVALMFRATLDPLKRDIALVRFDWPAASTSRIVCFKRLVLTTHVDNFMRLSQVSDLGLLRLKFLVYEKLHFRPEVSLGPFKTNELRRNLRIAIYPRMDSRRRRLLNHEEIAQHLTKNHHTVLTLKIFGSRSPEEQIAAYAHFDVVISVHGANLANALFMPHHSTYVEVWPNYWNDPWTAPYVQANSMQYISIVGKPHGDYSKLEQGANDADFTISISDLALALTKIGIAA